MEEKKACLFNECAFSDVRPAMTALPYPAIAAEEKNPAYAGLLSNDYCGAVSEMSAIAQYINNENRLSAMRCPLARSLLAIAMAEMMHLQKLGELIVLLGGSIDFSAAQKNGKRRPWTPEHIALPDRPGQMLAADIESEQAAIRQYRAHMKMIRDPYVNAVLARIVQDEEYHVVLLRTLAAELENR